MSGTEGADIRIAKEVERSPQQNQNLSLLDCAAGSKLADQQGFYSIGTRLENSLMDNFLRNTSQLPVGQSVIWTASAGSKPANYKICFFNASKVHSWMISILTSLIAK